MAFWILYFAFSLFIRTFVLDMREGIYFLLYICLFFMLPGCKGNRAESSQVTGDTLMLRHARNLTIVEFENRIEVTMRNPWDTTNVLGQYVLTEPLRNAAVFSSVHCALLHELGADEAVGGICDFEFFNLPYYKQAVGNGRIANLGNSMQPSLEKIIDLNPDALLPSPFENSGGLGRIERLGIPIIWCADYMENTPLGRAEWIRLYGRLFGCAEKADSIFESVETRYQELCAKARNTKIKPRLLPEMPWSGQWTLPGSGSSSTKLYQDAGADYLFANLEGAGGIPLSTEKVVDKAVEADVWIIKHHGPLDREQMNADTPLLSNIKAQIWWCDTSKTLIYEETPFHPERLLENLISILHPELGIRSNYEYFRPLEHR